MAGTHPAQPDVTLLLDMDGVIREATVSSAISNEGVSAWLGQPWSDIVGDLSGEKVVRMMDDARKSGISAFRQFTHVFPSGLELPMEFTTVLLGGRAGLLAIGKNLQPVAELQSRLTAAQQTIERDYWKLREIETRYRLVFDTSNEAVLLVRAANLKIVEANKSALAALALTPRRNEAISGRDLMQEVAEADQERVRDMLARVREAGKAPSILVHFGPAAKAWMLRGTLMTAEPGSIFLLQLTPVSPTPFGDLPKQHNIDDLVDLVPDGFAAIDEHGVVQRANQAFADLIQIGAKRSVVGERLTRWLSRPGADMAALVANVQRHGVVRLFATTIYGELGTDTEVEISAARHDVDERPLIVLIIRNVSRRLSPYGESDSLRTSLAAINDQVGKTPLRRLVKNTVEVVENHYVKAALELAGGNRTAAAEILGLSRQSLYAKLARYGLDDKGSEIEEADKEM